MRPALLSLALAGLWLALSGYFDKPLLLGLGAASVALTVFLVARLGFFEKALLAESFSLGRLLRYFGWMLVEIGRADWAVARVILGTGEPVRQRFIEIPCRQRSDAGKALFSNSITITPGTVAVETEGGQVIIHALTDAAADRDALLAMGARVVALERA